MAAPLLSTHAVTLDVMFRTSIREGDPLSVRDLGGTSYRCVDIWEVVADAPVPTVLQVFSFLPSWAKRV